MRLRLGLPAVLLVPILSIAGVVAASGPAGAAATAAAPIEAAVDARIAAMSDAELAGQLIMTGARSTGGNAVIVNLIRTYHLGSVILTGNSSLGVSATRAVTAQLQSATGAVKLFVSTDQEGGQVQRLTGPGFSTIPSAVVQGTWATTPLRAWAGLWARQLRSAGVNMDLAPVLDVVPAGTESSNPPIGWYDRQYGSTPATVASHGTAFARGMSDGFVVAVGKHFPGLGRVNANTDTTAHVVDSVTTRTDPFLQPFATAVTAGVPVVMMSSAYYSRIDSARPAVLSPTVITGMLRGDLGFGGIVISDSIGTPALSAYPVADRGVRFIQAGGDIVLADDPALVPALVSGLLNRMHVDSAFHAQVVASAKRVLMAKAVRGFIPSIPAAGQPIGHLDSAGTSAGHVQVAGWALDPETASPIQVHIYADGHGLASITANQNRPDVGARLPQWGPAHGFSASVAIAPGAHRVCVYAINVGPGLTVSLGCVNLVVPA